MKIREAITKVMKEEDVEAINNANNITVDKFSQQRENLNAIFASENLNELENLNAIVNAVPNMIINGIVYDLNGATASDVQVKFLSNPYEITHQNLLSSRMIGIQHEEVSVLSPLTDPRIGANNQPALSISTGILQAPQTLKLPVVQEFVAYTDLNNTGGNRTSRKVSRTGVDGDIPSPSGISVTSYAPYSGCFWNPRIGIIRQSTTPIFRKSDELNAAIDRNFSNDTIAPTSISQVFCDKIYDSSSRYPYTRCIVDLTTESVNPMAPQFVNNGISNFDTLDKSVEIWSPATRIRRFPDVTHRRVLYHAVEQGAEVVDAVGDYSEEKYKTDF